MSPCHMMALSALLNDAGPPAAPAVKSEPELKSHADGSELEVNESDVAVAPEKLFRSKIHPSLLADTKLVDIALRRKSSTKRNFNLDNCGSKLHRKSLEAGLRVKLVHSPSMYEIYFSLTPLSLHSKSLFSVHYSQNDGSYYTLEHTETLHNYRKNSLPQYAGSKSTAAAAGSLRLPSESHKKGYFGKRPLSRSGSSASRSSSISRGSSSDVSLSSLSPNCSASGESSGSGSDSGSGETFPRAQKTCLPRLAQLIEDDTESAEDTKSESTGSSEDCLSYTGASTNPSDVSEGASPQSSGSLSPQAKEPSEEELGRRLALFFTFGKFTTKTVSLIDSNIVDLSGVPWKVMKQFTYDHLRAQNPAAPDAMVGTFNNLDTAVSSLFRVPKYSLVRITKCAATNQEGSNIVKLETARPGDPWLIDDGNFIEDMVTSLGKKRQSPSNLFIKKIVARPRYKVEMKLYLVPSDEPMSFYVDQRIYERDLINGVIDVEHDAGRTIFTNFPPQPAIDRVKHLISDSRRMSDDELSRTSHVSVPNHMTEDLHKYFLRPSTFAPSDSSSSNASSTPSSRGSNTSGSVLASAGLPVKRSRSE